MRAILDRMKRWMTRNAEHRIVHFIPAPEGTPLTAHQSYMRLWLTDMFLERDREWFENQYPLVHATVQLSYAGQSASFSSVARAPEGRLGPGERRNYPLTPLLPWSGGVVEIEAGLSALAGAHLLAPALDVLQQVSRLIAPPLSAGLAVAEQIGSAIDGLLKAGDEPVVLGLHESFAAPAGGGLVLQPGHFVLVGREPSKLDKNRLSVVDGTLLVANGSGPEPLTGADYMVIGISGLEERDDWRFPALEELIRKAIEASLGADTSSYEAFRGAALAMALTSSDLTPVDRKRVARAVRDELAAARAAGAGAIGGEPPDLESIVARRALSHEDALATPDVSLVELLHGG